jgi:acyl-coenzyme A thioesterase PaaI-like protein
VVSCLCGAGGEAARYGAIGGARALFAQTRDPKGLLRAGCIAAMVETVLAVALPKAAEQATGTPLSAAVRSLVGAASLNSTRIA